MVATGVADHWLTSAKLRRAVGAIITQPEHVFLLFFFTIDRETIYTTYTRARFRHVYGLFMCRSWVKTIYTPSTPIYTRPERLAVTQSSSVCMVVTVPMVMTASRNCAILNTSKPRRRHHHVRRGFSMADARPTLTTKQWPIEARCRDPERSAEKARPLGFFAYPEYRKR
jgi:hypothetical protein